MKSAALLKAVYKDCLERGYVADGDDLYPPSNPKAIAIMEARSKRKPRTNHIKTGWIDDTRNIKNKEQRDMFVMLIEKELGVEVWPEFYFSTERLYRFDYAIPLKPRNSGELKIAIEQEGGIWAKGNSGHSSGTGIQRDMDKNNLAIAQGWVIIRRTPDQMMTSETIELIKVLMKQRIEL